MERTRYFLIVLITWIFISPLYGSYKSEIYSAYLNNRMDKWKVVIDRLNDQTNKSDKLILELLNYQYGYIAWCIGNERKDEVKRYLTLAEKNVESLTARNFELSLVNGYMAAFYGYRIVINRFSAPFNGSKSIASARKAIQLDPEQPFGFVQLGNIEFHMPSVFGGSKQKALDHYLIARSLMEQDTAWVNRNWNYLSLLTTIAQAYESIGKLGEAKKSYEEILALEPNFLWVKEKLYPQLLTKLKNE